MNSVAPSVDAGSQAASAVSLILTRAVRDLTAGTVVALAAVSFYISAASLMFQGALAPHLPTAIGAALMGAVVLALFAARGASLPLASVGPEPATVPVVAAIMAAVAAQAAPQATLATALAALAITGIAIGLSWWLMGRLGGGDLIRYIPYPVIGGFLGSIGWMILTGGLGVATGAQFRLGEALGWLSAQADLRLVTGVALGVLIWQVTLRVKHVFALPGVILLAGLGIHAGLALSGVDLAAARAQGWLLAPFSQTLPVWLGSDGIWAAIEWGVVAQQAGLILSAVIVATIGLLLSDTSLEVAWEERADINRDLRCLGGGNLLLSAAGGVMGGVSISRSMLNRAAGAASRGSGVVTAGLCLLAMGWGGPVLALVPRPLLGGLLIYLGLGMLKTWIIDSRLRLSRGDYLTVLGMVAITALVGFLPAVCVGVLACCVSFAISSARLSPVRRMIARSAWPSKVERGDAQASFLRSVGDRLRIVELQGVLFFGSATRLMQRLEALLQETGGTERLLFDFHHVRWIDSSAAQSLGRLFKQACRQGVAVELSHLSEPTRSALLAGGCLGAGGPVVHADIDAAVGAWDDDALARADVFDGSLEDWLAKALPPDVALADLLAWFEPLALARGEVLFTQGQMSDALYLVRSGRLGAYVLAQGQEMLVRTVHAGSAIGEMGLFRAIPRSATIRAEQPSEVLQLRRERLEALQREQPELAAVLYRVFLQQLAGRVDQLTKQTLALTA